MKDFIRKNVLALCCLSLVLSCCVTAALGYYLVVSQQEKAQTTKEKYAQYSWLMPMTEDYAYLHSEKYGKTLRGEDQDYQYFYLLAISGEVLDKHTAFKEIHQGKFYTESIGDGLYAYTEDNHGSNNKGAIDSEGNIVIPPEFNTIFYFCDGYAQAYNSREENVIIDAKGNIIYNAGPDPLIRENECKAAPLSHISDTRYLVCEDKPFVLNAKTGEKTEIDSRILERLTSISPLKEGGYIAYLSASDLDNNGDAYENSDAFSVFLNENFQLRDDVLYRYIGSLSDNGLRYAEKWKETLSEFLSKKYFKTYEKMKLLPTEKGYINENRKMVLSLPEETVFAFPFSEKKAVVYTKDKAVVIDSQGRILFEIEADITPPADSVFASVYSNYERADSVFRGGFAPIQKKTDCFGVIDADGKWVIRPEFKSAEAAADGVYIVEDDDKCGIIELKGGKKNAQ